MRSLLVFFIDVADDICQIVTLWLKYIESESEFLKLFAPVEVWDRLLAYTLDAA